MSAEGAGGEQANGPGQTGPADEMSIEDAVATQERMEADGKSAKSGYEAGVNGQVAEQSYAAALDQEVTAINNVAAGNTPVQGSMQSPGLAVEAVADPIGFDLAPDAVVTQAAYEIAPTGNFAGRYYGVVTAGQDGFETELDAVEAFQDVVEWYRSGEGATEYELGTTIYEAADGTFGHNDVVTFYSETSVSPFLDVPEGAQVVAVAHSHPGPTGIFNSLFGYDGEDFSNTDIRAQERMERQFGEGFSLYMVSPTNQLNVYPPEQ